MTSSPEGRQAVAWRWRPENRSDWEAWTFIKVRPEWLEGPGFVVEPLFALPAPVAAAPVGVSKPTDAQIKDATTEYLSHRGERPYRILRGGQELWETHAPAMRHAFRAAALIAPAKPAVAPTRWLVSSTPLPGSTCELVEAGQLSGDEPCECGECTVDECADCCSPADNYPKDREAADALAAKDAALSEITAENERLDASCTALDKYASEMMGRAEAAEAALSEMRAELGRARDDAERWRALMSSQRMHFMGCAGIELVNKPGTTSRKTADMIPVMKPGTYQHFGMEFWSEHSAFGNPEWPDDFERSLLVAYVDHLRAARAASQDEGEER